MRLIILFFGLLSYSMLAQEIKLSEVRVAFQKSNKSEVLCNYLMNSLDKYTEKIDPNLAAYKACATMMMANYLNNPLSKLGHFNSGKDLLEKCILVDQSNVELRYLRFSIQSKSPRFLGYTQSIEKDKAVLIASLNNLKDLQLKTMIVDFLKVSDELTIVEKQKIGA